MALHHHHHARHSHRHQVLTRTLESELGVVDASAGSERLAVPATRTVSKRDNCSNNSNSASCEKPTGSSNTVPIVLAAVIPIVVAIGVLLFIHRRRQKKQRLEDLNDKHRSLDFGMDEAPANGKIKGRGKGPEMSILETQQQIRRGRGLSMDMQGSPYLMPAGLQSSRESFHSMSRSMHDQDDPYRPVTFVKSSDTGSVYGSANGSIRGYPRIRPDNASTFTSSSAGTEAANANLLRNAQRMSKSYPVRGESMPPAVPEIHLPPSTDPQIPPPVPAHIREGLAPSSTVAGRGSLQTQMPDDRNSNLYLAQYIHSRDPSNASAQTPASPTEVHSKSTPKAEAEVVPLPRQRSMEAGIHNPNTSSYISESSDYGDAFKVTPPSPPLPPREAARPPPINTGIAQESMEAPMPPPMEAVEPYEPAPAGLGVEGLEEPSNRLSIIMRPVPIDDPSETAEQRANRIRSFYKEYFDDSKPDPVGGYYDDGYYDDEYYGEYLDDGAIFDPETGQFVVAGAPYAEPVTRRAMTPPPRAPPRFRGPPPRGHFASGSMSNFSGPRGRSAMSARSAPKRRLPPPSPLQSLPTPHKISADNMAFNPIDFAPPVSFRERQNGRRPDSPLGVARPYSPSVRSHVPLASPYSDLSAMPSPHALRKSGTFTALDFAPPPRFRGSDAGSDAGSIRSNRSGMSNVQIASLRAGAYRVSRIPKEVVGTRFELDSALKPTWDMRGKA